MNWKRTQTYLSLPGPRERQAFGPLCKVMDEIVSRTRYVVCARCKDSAPYLGPLSLMIAEVLANLLSWGSVVRYIDTLEATLASCAGLQDLYHHRLQFVKALDQCTRQVYQSRYVEAFLTIIQQMPATVVPGFGREVRTHGIYAGRVAQGMLTLVTPRVYGCACCDDRMTSSRWSAPRL